MAAAAVCYLPCVAFYHVLYGNIFGPATINRHMSKDLWHFGEIQPLLGVLVSPSRGLLVYQPWVVLAAPVRDPYDSPPGRRVRISPGCPGMARILPCRKRCPLHLHRGVVRLGRRLLLGVAAPHGYPPPAWPGVVPAIAAAWPRPRARSLIVALGFLGALTHIPCVYMGAAEWNDQTDHKSDLWSWSNAPFFHHRQR